MNGARETMHEGMWTLETINLTHTLVWQGNFLVTDEQWTVNEAETYVTFLVVLNMSVAM